MALLCCREEERLLDWLGDIRQPALTPVLDLGDEEEKRDVADLTDHQLVMQDVVLGLVRMDLLARLHYVLTVMKLKETVMVTGVLGLLVRLTRHSPGMVEVVSSSPLLSPRRPPPGPPALCEADRPALRLVPPAGRSAPHQAGTGGRAVPAGSGARGQPLHHTAQCGESQSLVHPSLRHHGEVGQTL